MKKIEVSESISNLLLISAFFLAATPFLLGDRLILIVSGVMKESAVMIDQFGTFLTKLLS